MAHKYIVIGEPIPVTKVQEAEKQGIWTEYKQRRFNYMQSLKNQKERFNYKQFIDKPIKLEIVFFMKATQNHPEKEKHIDLPPIFHLFNFVDYALQGIAYRKDCTISAVTLKKIYDSNPRTEIKVVRMR